jgi:HEAT repeat protein
MNRFLAAIRLMAGCLMIAGCGRDSNAPVLSGGREVESWVAALQDANPQVRRQAVLKLGNVGAADPVVEEALTGALADSDALVRRDAVLAVVKLEAPGEAIISRLQTMSRDDQDPAVRDAAARALRAARREK